MKTTEPAWLALYSHVDSAPAIEPLFLRWVHYKKQRYYQVYLGKDMLQDYLLTKSWGGMEDNRGRIIHIAYPSYLQAITEVNRINQVRRSRGYLLVTTRKMK